MPAASAPKAALTVAAVSPSNSALGLQLSANGNVAAWQEASIGAEVNGLKLLEVRVNVGDMVKRGQVLATFSVDAARADVLQVQASLAEAQANAAEAAANAQRARSLQDTGAISAQQINQFTTAEQTANARVEAARALLSAAQVRLKNGQLTAPDNGIISARSATVGAVVGAGSELFRMIRQGRLEWRAEVTSSEVARIKPGQVAMVTAASGAQVQGKVRVIAPTVDPVTRNALVYVDLPYSAGIKAGMFAKGEFDLGASNALTIAQQSVVVRDGFSYVFALTPDSHVSQVKVQTGRRLGDRVEIISGIKADAELVNSGAGFLNDGDLVLKVAEKDSNLDVKVPGKPYLRTQPAIK